MTYRKSSIDYKVNMVSLREMEAAVPMTAHERLCLRRWARNGHDVDSNPWNYFESDYSEMNYLKARRIKFGASHGPWDSWEYDVPIIRNETSNDFDYP